MRPRLWRLRVIASSSSWSSKERASSFSPAVLITGMNLLPVSFSSLRTYGGRAPDGTGIDSVDVPPTLLERCVERPGLVLQGEKERVHDCEMVSGGA